MEDKLTTTRDMKGNKINKHTNGFDYGSDKGNQHISGGSMHICMPTLYIYPPLTFSHRLKPCIGIATVSWSI